MTVMDAKILSEIIAKLEREASLALDDMKCREETLAREIKRLEQNRLEQRKRADTYVAAAAALRETLP